MLTRLRGATSSRRSAVLLLFGFVFVIVGLTYLGQSSEITRSQASSASYRAHLQLMPLDAWACLFIGAGGLSFVAGLTAHHTLGFTVLMAMCSWWGLEFIASWLSTGYVRAVLGALVWLLLAGILAVIVGWRDPPPKGQHLFTLEEG